MPIIVAQRILPPIASRFLLAYPGITLEISAIDTFIDVLAAGFDAGIRYDESIERDMIAIPVGPRTQRFILAAAPSYLAVNGTPQHPRDLLDHACIRHRFASGVIPNWEFERNGKVVKITPKGRVIASTAEMGIGAAVAGLGVVCTFEEYLSDALQSGQLVPVMEPWWQEFTGPAPLLSEPHPHACSAAGLRGFHQESGTNARWSRT